MAAAASFLVPTFTQAARRTSLVLGAAAALALYVDARETILASTVAASGALPGTSLEHPRRADGRTSSSAVTTEAGSSSITGAASPFMPQWQALASRWNRAVDRNFREAIVALSARGL